MRKFTLRNSARKLLFAIAPLAVLGLTAAPQASATNLALPDANEPASLTVIKYLSPATGDLGNGTLVSGLENTPVEGVTFRVRQVKQFDGVPVDLLTRDGWQLAGSLEVADILSVNTQFGPTFTRTTDPSGKASFTGMALGLYLVEETAHPAGVVGSLPFLVTLPLTAPSGDYWIYDVVAQPKGDMLQITKSVTEESAYTIGDTVTWTLEAEIPRNLEAPITSYAIQDTLDSRLALVTSDVQVALTGDGLSLITSDWTLTDQADFPGVEIIFTPAGVAKLNSSSLGAKQTVRVEFPTLVTATGVMDNQAELFVNEAAIHSNLVSTHWGGLEIVKENTQGTRLAGAEFRIYRSEADALAQNNELSIAGTRTFTTNSSGVVQISGLRYSRVTGVVRHPGYWLVETKAPAGYELLAEPIHVDVVGPASANQVQVVNVEHNAGFRLPLTGGAGSGFWLVSGLAILTVAAVIVGYRHKGHSRHSSDLVV